LAAGHDSSDKGRNIADPYRGTSGVGCGGTAVRLCPAQRIMLSKIFKRRGDPAAPSPSVPDGKRIYAVGDIHGRLDLLDELLEMIAADDSARTSADTVIIFLGDLVDRGPDSAGVVERLRQLAETDTRLRFLTGNHEEVFYHTMRSAGEEGLKFFCRIGGRETILSYGIPESDYNAMDYPELKAALVDLIPESHLSFLAGFEDMIEIGDYLFVHAGIRPDVPLEQQRPRDLRWIREPFLSHAAPHSRVVVHGHTILPEIDIQPNRIGIDTGAYASGKLTAIGLQGRDRWVVQT
jgi:serine/threonine protein phosphatase 1